MPVQMPEQEREFAISRIETENGIFRADGVATIVGINVVELNYRELWRLGTDGWFEIDLSDQQSESLADLIFVDVAKHISAELIPLL